jgi:hypothetical protein
MRTAYLNNVRESEAKINSRGQHKGFSNEGVSDLMGLG